MIIQIKRIISCSKSGTNANIRGYGTHNNTHTQIHRNAASLPKIFAVSLFERVVGRGIGEKKEMDINSCVCVRPSMECLSPIGVGTDEV